MLQYYDVVGGMFYGLANPIWEKYSHVLSGEYLFFTGMSVQNPI